MIDSSSMNFVFDGDDLARELARFGDVTASAETLSPTAITVLTTFIGTCADIHGARLGLPPVADELALIDDELVQAITQRDELAALIVRGGGDLSVADRETAREWLEQLRAMAVAAGNVGLLAAIFVAGIDRTARAASGEDDHPRAA